MADNVADVLERAADLIAAPGAWMQKIAIARGSGDPCAWDDPEAKCYCLFGAVRVAGGLGDDTLSYVTFEALERFLPSPIEWNDAPERTQDEVVAKLREAAAKARAEQAQA